MKNKMYLLWKNKHFYLIKTQRDMTSKLKSIHMMNHMFSVSYCFNIMCFSHGVRESSSNHLLWSKVEHIFISC